MKRILILAQDQQMTPMSGAGLACKARSQEGLMSKGHQSRFATEFIELKFDELACTGIAALFQADSDAVLRVKTRVPNSEFPIRDFGSREATNFANGKVSFRALVGIVGIALGLLMMLVGTGALAESSATPAPMPAVTINYLNGTDAAPGTTAAATASAEIEASADADARVTLAFEDGFSLTLPAGWKYYPVNDDMAAQGVLYCLGSADGDCWLYIQNWATDCTSVEELSALIDGADGCSSSGVRAFNGTDFVVYDLPDADVSCCATLMNGQALNFVFTPQSDTEYMLTAVQITESFTKL